MAGSYAMLPSKGCDFCSEENASYTCPRCNRHFCSVECYKHQNHIACSEDFYRDWVMTCLKNNQGSIQSRKAMIEMLQRVQQEDDASTDSDDDCSQLPLADQLASLNLDGGSNTKALWEMLTEEERLKFKLMLEKGEISPLVPLWKPWWMSKASLVLIEELDAKRLSDQGCSKVESPSTKKLLSLTSRTPSPCIKHNMLNILYAYAYVARLYNGDHLSLPVEVVEGIQHISAVLSNNSNFDSGRAAIQTAVQKLLSEKTSMYVSREFITSVINDVRLILEGPNERQPLDFVLHALKDLHLLVKKARKEVRKASHNNQMKSGNDVGSRHGHLTKVLKKIDYLMSWAVEHKDALQEEIVDINLELLQATEDEVAGAIVSSSSASKPERPLITELT